MFDNVKQAVAGIKADMMLDSILKGMDVNDTDGELPKIHVPELGTVETVVKQVPKAEAAEPVEPEAEPAEETQAAEPVEPEAEPEEIDYDEDEWDSEDYTEDEEPEGDNDMEKPYIINVFVPAEPIAEMVLMGLAEMIKGHKHHKGHGKDKHRHHSHKHHTHHHTHHHHHHR